MKTAPSAAKALAQAAPLALAVLTVVCGVLIPREDAFYVLGHSLALVLAPAVPLIYGWFYNKARSAGPAHLGVHRFLLISLSIFGLISAVSSGVLLSYASAESAAGDIGGIFVWLLSSAGLLFISIAAAITWPKWAA